ncbi:hypothetical protein [Phytohabitans aurantiacus]|uniref:Secreted protein n=1 Tax=Phytohabitans aurantiacus TaxID=3016789 RepID=A0ABQ5R0J1_9ACTN|nr:hypothetical protein [Phytohabitans aurantiacus]GLH99464.1 hypothetical protein Pa4123_47400 [Phytohabitans aurantiacus]
MRDLFVNLLASVVAGTAVWLAQRVRGHLRLARKRAFFGIDDGTACQLAVSRHASSSHHLSVHRGDVAALVELATIARDCGGRADLVPAEDLPEGIGRLTEFCVGGPGANARTAAHLRSILRGIEVTPFDPETRSVEFSVGTTTYRRERHRVEYVFLARAWGPAGGRPVFVLGGQTAPTNLAAARYLATRYRDLHRRYGADQRFCLVLRIVEPGVYGSDYVELVDDVTEQAFPLH